MYQERWANAVGLSPFIQVSVLILTSAARFSSVRRVARKSGAKLSHEGEKEETLLP
jgi:hypothetical protein